MSTPLGAPLGAGARHLCVDAQNLFARETPWHTPWLRRVLPQILALARARPERTIYTRFIPARRPGEGRGTWCAYYERWADMTRERLAPDMIELVPELAALVPPDVVHDKAVYSPWFDGGFRARLEADGVDTLVVSGGETDVCVLATVLGAVDLGYRVVLATGALCSSSDRTYDALMTLYRERYATQVEMASVDEILAAWPA